MDQNTRMSITILTSRNLPGGSGDGTEIRALVLQAADLGLSFGILRPPGEIIEHRARTQIKPL